MRATSVVVRHPLLQNPPQVSLVQRNQEIQTFALDASNQSFAEGMRLPLSEWRDSVDESDPLLLSFPRAFHNSLDGGTRLCPTPRRSIWRDVAFCRNCVLRADQEVDRARRKGFRLGHVHRKGLEGLRECVGIRRCDSSVICLLGLCGGHVAAARSTDRKASAGLTLRELLCQERRRDRSAPALSGTPKEPPSRGS